MGLREGLRCGRAACLVSAAPLPQVCGKLELPDEALCLPSTRVGSAVWSQTVTLGFLSLGVYKVTPRSCHRFEQAFYTYDT